MSKQAEDGFQLLGFSPLRILMSLFFLVYTYVVARSLIPLPDQAPKIEGLGVFCLTGGLVIAFYMLTSSYRLFLVGTWFFIPFAIKQMTGKQRLMEMMLEPYLVEQTTLYCLYAMLVMLISPPLLRLFHKPASAYRRPEGLMWGKGIPF